MSSASLAAQVRDGKIALAKKNYNQALSLFDTAKKANPSDGEAYYYSALAYERTGNKQAALTEYRRATELRLSADLKDKSFWKLVLHYKHVQDWENLYIEADRFLAFRPNRKVEEMRDLAEANTNPNHKRIRQLLAEANTFEKKGQYAQAAATLKEAVGLDPKNVKLLWRTGDNYRKADRCNDALPMYRRSVEIDKNGWYGHFQVAVCEYGLQHFDAAVSAFDIAEQKNDKADASFTFYLNTGRGLAYLELERVGDAKKSLAILKKYPKLFQKSNPAAILNAMILLLDNDRGSIEPFIGRISTTDPDRPAVPLLRSVRYVSQGDFVKASEQMDELFHLNEKRGSRLDRYVGQSLILIAHYFNSNGQTDQALQSLQRYQSLRLDNVTMTGVFYQLVAGNPVTPFREDQKDRAVEFGKDVARFAKYPNEAAKIVEGRLLYESGEKEKALTVLRQAKSDPLCRFYLADLYLANGNPVEARELLKSALHDDDRLIKKLADFKHLDELWQNPAPVLNNSVDQSE